MQQKNFRNFGLVLTAAGAIGLCASAKATPSTIYTLTDGGSTARIDADSGVGMFDWEVGGQDQLEKQWFYYRAGNATLAAPINTISASSLLYLTGNTLITSYTNSAFTLTISYVLTGGSQGANSADILETITVLNTSGAALDFSLFQYSNFDLLGTPGGDTVTFTGWDGVVQKEGVFGIQEGIIQPTASFREAALTGSGGTLDNLANIANYNLNNNGGPLPGDVTWAFQWDYQIPAGQSLDVYKDKTLIAPQVPEPTSAMLLAVGVGVLALRRRMAR